MIGFDTDTTGSEAFAQANRGAVGSRRRALILMLKDHLPASPETNPENPVPQKDELDASTGVSHDEPI